MIALLAQGSTGIDTAPVELHRAADTVGAGPQNNYRLIGFQIHIVTVAVVAQVEIIGTGGIFRAQGVDLAHVGADAGGITLGANIRLPRPGDLGDLPVGKSGLLGGAQQLLRHFPGGGELLFQCDHPGDLVQKPFIDVGKFVNAVDGITRFQRLHDGEDPFFGRFPEILFQILKMKSVVFVGHQPAGADLQHAQGFLQCLLELAADRHHFAHRLHTRAEAARDPAKFFQIPAGNLHHHVIQGRLEKGFGHPGDGIGQLVQSVSQGQLGGHEGQGIAGRLRGQGGAAREPGIDLDDAIIL